MFVRPNLLSTSTCLAVSKRFSRKPSLQTCTCAYICIFPFHIFANGKRETQVFVSGTEAEVSTSTRARVHARTHETLEINNPVRVKSTRERNAFPLRRNLRGLSPPQKFPRSVPVRTDFLPSPVLAARHRRRRRLRNLITKVARTTGF